MDAIAEIDKAGRLVIPKKLRDALHLVPGTRLTLKQESDRLVIQLEARPRGLYLKKGTLVYDVGLAPPADVVDWVSQDREARGHALAGQYSKP